MKSLAVMILGVFIWSSLPVEAEAGHRKAKMRGKMQKARIKKGVKNGSLTRREAGQLRRQQKRIKNRRQNMVHRAERDGVITAKERAKINRWNNRAQNRASKNIFKKKHNKRGQPDKAVDFRRDHVTDHKPVKNRVGKWKDRRDARKDAIRDARRDRASDRPDGVKDVAADPVVDPVADPVVDAAPDPATTETAVIDAAE